MSLEICSFVNILKELVNEMYRLHPLGGDLPTVRDIGRVLFSVSARGKLTSSPMCSKVINLQGCLLMIYCYRVKTTMLRSVRL